MRALCNLLLVPLHDISLMISLLYAPSPSYDLLRMWPHILCDLPPSPYMTSHLWFHMTSLSCSPKGKYISRGQYNRGISSIPPWPLSKLLPSPRISRHQQPPSPPHDLSDMISCLHDPSPTYDLLLAWPPSYVNSFSDMILSPWRDLLTLNMEDLSYGLSGLSVV
jgi:hypothetical protein